METEYFDKDDVISIPTPVNFAVFIVCHVRPLTNPTVFFSFSRTRRFLFHIDGLGAGWFLHGVPPADMTMSRYIANDMGWELYDPWVNSENHGRARPVASQTIFREELYWPATKDMPERVLHLCSNISADVIITLSRKYNLGLVNDQLVGMMEDSLNKSEGRIIIPTTGDVMRFGNLAYNPNA